MQSRVPPEACSRSRERQCSRPGAAGERSCAVPAASVRRRVRPEAELRSRLELESVSRPEPVSGSVAGWQPAAEPRQNPRANSPVSPEVPKLLSGEEPQPWAELEAQPSPRPPPACVRGSPAWHRQASPPSTGQSLEPPPAAFRRRCSAAGCHPGYSFAPAPPGRLRSSWSESFPLHRSPRERPKSACSLLPALAPDH